MAKCGRCGQAGTNVTVANIRDCYNGTDKAHGEPEEVIKNNPHPPTERQIRFVLGLQAERALPEDYKAKTDSDLRAMDQYDVSALINTLKLFKIANKTTWETWRLPAGRYALYFPGADDQPGAYSYVDRQDLVKPSYGEWRFFLVDKPTEGKWKGYTFIKRLIGGGDNGDYRTVDISRSQRTGILKAIEKDPKQAMLDFGLQSGSCGHCGRALSNKESLERGIGPICAGKMGW